MEPKKRSLEDKAKILMGISFKGDNRNESREIILAGLITRMLHETFNVLGKVLAKLYE
jgi:hypothetical protein